MDKDKVQSWAGSIEAIAVAIKRDMTNNDIRYDPATNSYVCDEDDDEDIRYEVRKFCNEIMLYVERIEKNAKEEK